MFSIICHFGSDLVLIIVSMSHPFNWPLNLSLLVINLNRLDSITFFSHDWLFSLSLSLTMISRNLLSFFTHHSGFTENIVFGYSQGTEKMAKKRKWRKTPSTIFQPSKKVWWRHRERALRAECISRAKKREKTMERTKMWRIEKNF